MSISKKIKIKTGIAPTTPNPSSGRRGNTLPTTPGVYLFKDGKGRVVYVGKASSLKSRVRHYFQGTDGHGFKTGWPRITDPRIAQMVKEVRRIDYQVTDSVIEALILEANLIRKYMPRYNVKAKDDKSFLYVVVTREQWPKVQLVRGNELAQYRHPERSEGSRGSKDGILRSPRGSLRMTGGEVWKVFGPYTSASAIRAALDLIRKWFPWSMCRPFHNPSQPSTRTSSVLDRPPLTFPPKADPPRAERGGESENVPPLKISLRPGGPQGPEGGGRGSYEPRPCFDYHIGRCPGVCVGVITRREYMKNIRNVILILSGRKARAVKNVEREMTRAAAEERFEEAEKLRRKLFALQHIRDVAVLKADSIQLTAYSPSRKLSAVSSKPINVLGRIEGYDISNISGTSAVGSMVVFQDGEPAKSEYRRFRIKAVKGINDVAMLREVLQRRFKRITNHESRIMGLKKDHDSLFMSHDSQIWPLPDLLVIDGGWGQVNAAQEVVDDKRRQGLRKGRRPCLPNIPIVGIAKGFKRKQDRPIFDKNNLELARIVENYKNLLLRVRDEAHRFAVVYHRKRMRKRIKTPS